MSTRCLKPANAIGAAVSIMNKRFKTASAGSASPSAVGNHDHICAGRRLDGVGCGHSGSETVDRG